MKHRLLVILAVTLATITGVALESPAVQAAPVINASCNMYPNAPVLGSNYIVGKSDIICSGSWDTYRLQTVLQDANGNNIPGTASGWAYFNHLQGNTAWVKSNPKTCLSSAPHYFRTEAQASVTDTSGNYSGIGYAHSSFVTKNCGTG